MTLTELLAYIDANINTKTGTDRITGAMHNSVLKETITSLIDITSTGFGGDINTSDDPGEFSKPVYFIAKETGTYEYCGGVTVENLPAFIVFDGDETWRVQEIDVSVEVEGSESNAKGIVFSDSEQPSSPKVGHYYVFVGPGTLEWDGDTIDQPGIVYCTSESPVSFSFESFEKELEIEDIEGLESALQEAMDAADNAQSAAESAQSSANNANQAINDHISSESAHSASAIEMDDGSSVEESLIKDAPSDGKPYIRKDAAWEEMPSTGLPSTWEANAADIRALTDHDAGMDVGNYATGAVYEYDETSTASDDGDTILKPDDVDSADPGRWVKEKTFSEEGHEHAAFDEIYWEPESIEAATSEHPRWDDSEDEEIYGRDKFGYGILPSGRRGDGGSYYSIGSETSFWSSDADNTEKVPLIMNIDSGWGAKNFFKPKEGYPIRLVRSYTTEDGDKIDGRRISAAFTDPDGNEYEGVIIGDQVWLTENLKTTKYNNGDDIPTGLTDTEWGDTTDGAYSVYDYNEVSGIDSESEMIEAYGLLYNWYAVDDSRGLGDSDWHVPSDAEFTELTDYVTNNYSDVNVGDSLKSVRQVNSPFFYESEDIIRPKENLSGERKKILPDDIVGNIATTNDVDFSTNIPFNSMLSAMPQTASDAERVFKPITTDAISGGRCIVVMEADGNSDNIPGFDTAFKQSPDSMIWKNDNGTKNTIDFWYDGTTYWYTIVRESSNLVYKDDVLLKGGASGPYTPTHDDDPTPKKWVEDEIKKFTANYYPGVPSEEDGEDLGWYGVEWDEGRVNSGCIRTGALSGYVGGGAYEEAGYDLVTRPLSNVPENKLFVHNRIKSVMLLDDGTENYDLDPNDNHNKSGELPSVSGTVTSAGRTSLHCTGLFTDVEDDYIGRYVHITTSGKLNIYCLITAKVSDDELTVSDPRNGSNTSDIFEVDDTFEICTARFDGVDGQAMVRIPKFYYFHTFESSPTGISGKQKVSVGVSLYPYDNFSVHPAFVDGDANEVDAIYYSKFEAISDTTGIASLPDSLPLTDQDITEFRTDAQARGSGWQQEMFWYRSAIQLLFYVEYADLNSQMRLQAFTEGSSTSSWKRKTGRTLSAGNSSITVFADTFHDEDIEDSTSWEEHKAVAMCYRGIENLYGHLWTFLDAINVNDYNVYVTNNKSVIASDTAFGYDDLEVDIPGNNYFNTIHPVNGCIIPATTGGGSVENYCDYVWSSSGWRVARAGGYLYNGARAGVAALYANRASTHSSWTIGARLCF